MTTSGSSTFKIERFSGNRNEHAVWKDKLFTLVRKRDEDYQRSMLEKDKPQAKVLMATFFKSTPPCPPEPADGETEPISVSWERMHWKRGISDAQQLLQEVLPNAFLATLSKPLSELEICEVWRKVERTYGDSDASTLISLSQQWQKALSSQWGNLRSLFSQLKKNRNEANRKLTAVQLKGEMFNEVLLCTEVLNQLPAEVWASSIKASPESYTIETVETALVTLFGDKTRHEITSSNKSTPVNVVKPRKRKGASTEKDGKCFYCFKPGHFKPDCEVKKANRANGIFRTDIKTETGAYKNKKLKTGLNVVNNKFADVAASVATELETAAEPAVAISVANQTSPSTATMPVATTTPASSENCDGILFEGENPPANSEISYYVGSVQHDNVESTLGTLR